MKSLLTVPFQTPGTGEDISLMVPALRSALYPCIYSQATLSMSCSEVVTEQGKDGNAGPCLPDAAHLRQPALVQRPQALPIGLATLPQNHS